MVGGHVTWHALNIPNAFHDYMNTENFPTQIHTKNMVNYLGFSGVASGPSQKWWVGICTGVISIELSTTEESAGSIA